MRKGLVTLGLATTLALSSVFSSFAGQAIIENDKVKYLKNDGTYAVNEYIEYSDKTWLYFDENGYMDKADYDYKIKVDSEQGWTNDVGGWRYYIDKENYLTNDWRKSGRLWFYLGQDGYQLLNQWHREEDGKWYYLDADGAMMTNATTPDGYTVNEDGCWTVDGVVQIQ